MQRFGKFEFDVVTRRLRADGTDIHLPPKAFDLLAALLEKAPGVVSKRELHARLWPGGVVADATLVALVKQLRAALDDRDRANPLIRTAHRVGYALEAPVDRREAPMPATLAHWVTVGQRRMPLQAGDNFVGRDATARVRIDDAAVSRRHARIVVSAVGAQIEDLRSKNGTYVDGRRLETSLVPLRNGMQLVFGRVDAAYGESAAGTPTLTHFGSPED